MKVFAEPLIENFCINRISHALKDYAPENIKFVGKEEGANLVIHFVHGHRKRVWWKICRLKEKGCNSAIVQLQLKDTANPETKDWLEIWENSKLTWSYYNLPQICIDEGTPTKFNFYHAPLGVDGDKFKDFDLERNYIIGIHSKGWSRESMREVVAAAREVGKTVLNFEDEKDYGEGVEYTGRIKDNDLKMAYHYSKCKYVSGLRRPEGFELPVIEGLMCGARPIVFDLPCYRQWYDGLAEFIPSEGRAVIIPALVELFKKDPKPVTEEEKELVKEKFNWEKIARGFWKRI